MQDSSLPFDFESLNIPFFTNLPPEEKSELICKETLLYLDFSDQIEYLHIAIEAVRERKLQIQQIYEEKKKKLEEEFKESERRRASQMVTLAFEIGRKGDGPGEFFRPWGVFADHKGRILVSDRMNHRIQIFGESGEFLHKFGEAGSGDGQFCRPAGIVVDKKNRLIIADKDNHRIQIFTFRGKFLFSFGKFGSNPGELNYPWGVAANSSCQIAVSDYNRVQLFSEKGLLLALCDFGKGIPRGLIFYKEDSLLVTDFEKHRVKILDKNLRCFGSFGQKGEKPGEFFRPQDLACDKFGRVAVSDSKNYRIQIFNSKAKPFKIFGSQGSEFGQFDCSQGICFHPNGNLIVCDLNNHRIQIFKIPKKSSKLQK